MHPIERLRHVARVEGADPGLVAREAAVALAEVASSSEIAGLVPACRRLVERHPTNGPLWWLSARVLSSADPFDTAREAAAALANDPTERRVATALPDDASILVVGWPDVTAAALRRRGDLEILVVASGGDGVSLARRLAEAGGDVALVPDRGIASAATLAGVVLVEALAAGPSGLLAAPGSHAAAAVAQRSGVPVWAVAGVGRILPGPLWNRLLTAVDEGGLEPWERDVEVVPAELVSAVITPDGHAAGVDALAVGTCPVAPELLRPTA